MTKEKRAKLIEKHLKLCTRNLRSKRVRCCADCPFEDVIVAHRPCLKKLFVAKRKNLRCRRKRSKP